MKHFKINKNILYITILALAFCIYFITAPEKYKLDPLLMNFIYAVSISIIAACIFYFFNIYLPEQKRKTIIRQDFEEQYLYFKKECIYIFLSALGKSINPKLVQKLCDLDEFKKYFKEKCGNAQVRWDKVATELDCNKIFRKNILVQLGILRNEVAFMFNNTEINNKYVLSFFKLLSQNVYGYRVTGINMEYNERNRLLNFLWELFTGWSKIDGYRGKDIVEIMIKKI